MAVTSTAPALFRRGICWLKRLRTPVLPFERLHCVRKEWGKAYSLEFYHPNRGMVAHINFNVQDDALAIMELHVHAGPPDTQLEYMRTLPNYRNRGMGNRLLAIAFDEARKLGLRIVRINQVHPFATRTIDIDDWYHKHGFLPGPEGKLEATVSALNASHLTE